MKLTFDKNEKQIELFKACASKNCETAKAARESLAELLQPVLEPLILQGDTVSNIYEDVKYAEGTTPSYPLYPFFDEGVDQFTIWSQNLPGSLATNYVQGNAEVMFQVYNLDSAWSIGNRYAKDSRLDVLSAAITKFLNTFRYQQNNLGWNVLMKSLANAVTNTRKHVIRAEQSGSFLVNDLNKLATRSKRILSAFTNGTPDPLSGKGITDMAVSPEIIEQIRSMAYQPVNTRAGSLTTSGATAIAAPDSVRDALWNGGGTNYELYGITFHELLELGTDTQSAYNTLFSLYAGSTSYTKEDGTGGATFGATDEILFGWDATKPGAVRPLETSEGAALSLKVDDSFPARSEKMGWYAGLREGRMVFENRKFSGLIVTAI